MEEPAREVPQPAFGSPQGPPVGESPGGATDVSGRQSACRYCGSGMPHAARLCSVCKLNVVSWKNSLVYVAGIVALLSGVASAATYVLNTFNEMVKESRWKDEVKIIDYSSDGKTDAQVVVANSGDGPVYLNYAKLVWEGGFLTVFLGEKLNKNDLSNHIPKSSDERLKNPALFVLSDKADGSLSEISEKKIMDRESACIIPLHYIEGSQILQSTREFVAAMKLNLVERQGNMTLFYTSIHTGKMSTFQVKTIAIFVLLDNKSCRDQLPDMFSLTKINKIPDLTQPENTIQAH